MKHDWRRKNEIDVQNNTVLHWSDDSNCSSADLTAGNGSTYQEIVNDPIVAVEDFLFVGDGDNIVSIINIAFC